MHAANQWAGFKIQYEVQLPWQQSEGDRGAAMESWGAVTLGWCCSFRNHNVGGYDYGDGNRWGVCWDWRWLMTYLCLFQVMSRPCAWSIVPHLSFHWKKSTLKIQTLCHGSSYMEIQQTGNHMRGICVHIPLQMEVDMWKSKPDRDE